MSVTMRQDTRNAFVSTIPVLTPLYSNNCDAWQIASEGELLCGRGSECQIIIPDDSIEEQHCVFNFRAGALTIQRLAGRVWINDLPVTRQETLAVGDILTLGPHSFRIESEIRRISAPAIQPTNISTPAINPQIPQAPMASLGPVAAPPEKSAAAAPQSLISAAIDERLAAIEGKTRLLEQREQQTKELQNLVQERERTLADRIRAMDERAGFLNEQKATIDGEQTGLKALKQDLQKQQQEVERRIQLVADRENQLQSHVEASATAYAQLEQTRVELTSRLESLSQREAAVQAKQSELAQQTSTIEQLVARNAADAIEQKSREEALAAREAEIHAANAALVARESAAAEAEQAQAAANKLQQEAEARLREAEEKCHKVVQMEKLVSEQAARLDLETAEQQKSTEEIDRIRAELQEQKSANETLAAQLKLKAAELETYAAGLAVSKAEAEESLQRSTPSVGELAALAGEREAATHARLEALQATDALRLRSAEVADQQARLIQWQAELESRHAELADRIVSVKQSLRANSKNLQEASASVTNNSDEQTLRIQEEWQNIAARQKELTVAEIRIAELEQAARDALSCAESSTAGINEKSEAIQTEWATLTERQAEVAASEARIAELEQAARDALSRAESSTAGINEKSEAIQTEWATLAERQAEVAASEARIAELEQAARDALSRAESSTAGINEKSEAIQTEWATLAERQAEIAAAEARIAELEQAARDAFAKAEASTVSIDEHQKVMAEESQQLAQRQAELATAEARAAQVEAAARAEMQKAEAEREALQNSYKDMICEKNSLMQMSQDLQSRSTGLSERESILVAQTEELRNKFQALNQQNAALDKQEAELKHRAAELHRRVAGFEAEIKERRSANGPDNEATLAFADRVANSDDSDQLKSLSDAVEASQSEVTAITSERDSLMIAVRELQKAMISAREDVEEAKRIRERESNHEQAMAALYQTIEDRSNQLQIMECKLKQAEEGSAELHQQLAEFQAQAEVRTAGGDSLDSIVGSPEERNDESELLSELNSLRAELAQSASGDPKRQEQYNRLLSERDAVIGDLRDQLETLQKQLSDAGSNIERANSVSPIQMDEIKARIESSEEVLRDRDDLIRELRARLGKATESSANGAINDNNIDVSELQAEARELDRRATLLDAREEEVRERLRMVTQTEEEVESQRRQLLDARQQLELARAEIQVAMKQHSAQAVARTSDETPIKASSINHQASPQGSGSGFFGNDSYSESALTEIDPPADSSDSASDLRSELANLFGVRKPAPEAQIPAAYFPDVSEPGGENNAVELRFGEDASMIVKSSMPSPESADSGDNAREENSDDFVRDYMEQLLSRSRKSAGNSLPTELKTQTAKEQPPVDASKKAAPASKAAAKSEAKAAPKVKSFIDQYMSGGFGDLTGDGSMSASVPVEAPEETESSLTPTGPVIPRVKVDRAKLRENMDSFRSLSTQSVENALVNHAIRTEQNNINGRIMVTFVMVTMSVFLAIANVKGIINHPSLIWVSLVGAIGSGAELLRKWYSVKERCKNALQPEGKLPTSSVPLTGEFDPETRDLEPVDVAPTENHAAVDQETSAQEFAPRKRPAAIVEEPKEPEYFEL